MKEQRSRGSRGIVRTIGAFTLGATIGSVTALLLAPASGQVTRRRIGLKIRSFQQSAGRQLHQAQKRLVRKAQSLRTAASQQINHAREWVVDRVVNGNGRRPSRRRAAHHA